MSEEKQEFIDQLAETIMEEMNFNKKYEMMIFIKYLEDHMINLYGSTPNGEIYESEDESNKSDSSETNESDITEENYEIEENKENGIIFKMLK